MINMKLFEAAAILGIKEAPRDTAFKGLSIDTRTLEAGNLFIAIPGSRVDGHDFIAEAERKGAAGALVSRKIDSPLPQIIVGDVIAALGKLAESWRNQFAIPIVAVTGSNGKTTLKAMITSILIAACRGDESQVLAAKGTFNNHLGLPLTLANLRDEHHYAVIEMGMNHFGEIAYLSKLARPHLAVITNAAAAHLEGVGDLAGVARAKAEIFQGLEHQGIAVLNRDDTFFTFWREQVGQRRLLTFGYHPDADVRALSDSNHIHLQTREGSIMIKLPLLGSHNVMNALGAAAAALALNINLLHIKTGLENIRPVPGRLELHQLPNDVNIIDDTYNANPVSLKAAIETLAAFAGKKILVLGDMKELGPNAKSIHHAAGVTIRAAGIDYLFTYGDLSANTATAFGEGGFHFNEQTKLVTALKPLLCKQTTILVKGSRSMHMENVVNELVQ